MMDAAGSTPGGRWVRRLTAATALGLAHWFFGNLYEAVVFWPNQLAGGMDALLAARALFRASSPIAYFLPWSPLTVAAAVAAAAFARARPEAAWLRRAAVAAAGAGLLTGAIVVRVNLVVFFGPVTPAAERLVGEDRWVWAGVAAARLTAVGVGLVCATRAWAAQLADLPAAARPGGPDSPRP